MRRTCLTMAWLAVACVCVPAVQDLAAQAKKEPVRSKADIEKLIADLRDKDANVRQRAAMSLSLRSLDVDKDVPALIEALKDREHDVAYHAQQALVRAGAAAVPALRAALKGKDFSARFWAIKALGGIGPRAKGTLADLTEILKDENVYDRVAAAFAVYQISGSAERSLPVLRQALKESSALIRRQAAFSLGEIGPDAASALGDLTKCLKDQDAHVRVRAAMAVYQVGGPAEQVVPLLLRALKDKATRFDAVDALGLIGAEAKTAVPELIALLRGGEGDVAAWAARALGGLGPDAKDAVPALIAALKGGDETLRWHAISALEDIGPGAADAAPAFIGLLEERFWSFTAAKALAEIGPPSKATVSALRKALTSPNKELRANACTALQSLGTAAEEAVPELVTALQDKEIRSRAATALSQIGAGAKKAVPALLAALQGEDKDFRLSAAFALARIAPREKAVVDALIEGLETSRGWLGGRHQPPRPWVSWGHGPRPLSGSCSLFSKKARIIGPGRRRPKPLPRSMAQTGKSSLRSARA